MIQHRRHGHALSMAAQHAGTMDHLNRHFPGYASRVIVPGGELAGLGFSFKPPSWLRNIAGAVMKGTQVSVPTPAGVPIVVDGADPNALKKVLDALKGTKISTQVGTPRPSLPQQAENAIESIPGGWFTVAAVGLGVLLLVKAARH